MHQGCLLSYVSCQQFRFLDQVGSYLMQTDRQDIRNRFLMRLVSWTTLLSPYFDQSPTPEAGSVT